MPRRVGRPGLVGTMARTAVIAGTATAVSGGMQRSAAEKQAAAMSEEQEKLAMQAQMAEMQQQLAAQQAAPAAIPPAAPAAGGGDVMAQLQQLGEMKAQGLLTDEEFAAAKAKLLG